MANLPETMADTLRRHLRAAEPTSFTMSPQQNQFNYYRAELFPHIRALPATEQSEFMRMVAQIAIGKDACFRSDQSNAQDILWLLRMPWPVDDRFLLLPAKNLLSLELTSPSNLRQWVDGDEESQRTALTSEQGYALRLFSILLIVSDDDELHGFVEYVKASAGRSKFYEKICENTTQNANIRLCSPRQFTRDEFIAHFMAMQRSRRRRPNSDQKQQDPGKF